MTKDKNKNEINLLQSVMKMNEKPNISFTIFFCFCCCNWRDQIENKLDGRKKELIEDENMCSSSIPFHKRA